MKNAFHAWCSDLSADERALVAQVYAEHEHGLGLQALTIDIARLVRFGILDVVKTECGGLFSYCVLTEKGLAVAPDLATWVALEKGDT